MADIQANLRNRLRRIDRAVSTQTATDTVIQDYDFRVSPTCPPSTSVVIRQGKAWLDMAWWLPQRYHVQRPETVLDFTSDDIKTYDNVALDLSFQNAGYYKAIAVLFSADWWLDNDYDHTFDYACGETEHATAGDAEGEIDAILHGRAVTNVDYPGDGLYIQDAFPLWSFILRNNGVVQTPGQILAVDVLNRGRSYMYRDLRPGKHYITA